MVKLLNALVVFLLAVAVPACTQHGGNGKTKVTPTQTVEQQAQQQIAVLRQAQDEETKYLKELAAAVRKEPRNGVWATAKEAELQRSYTEDQAVPKGALKSVDCRRSKCEVQLELESETPTEAQVRQMTAIDQWISWSQPCGYTMTAGPGQSQASRTIHVFLDCSE